MDFQDQPQLWEFSLKLMERFFTSVEDTSVMVNKYGEKIELKSPVKKRLKIKRANAGATGSQGYDFRLAWEQFLKEYNLNDSKIKKYGAECVKMDKD